MSPASHGLSCDCGASFATVEALQQHLQEETPDELICIVDTSQPEGRDMTHGYADVLHGLVVVYEVYDEDACCEECGQQGAYCLKNTIHGVGLCRKHLVDQPANAAVVTDKDDVKQYRMPSAPVRGGEA